MSGIQTVRLADIAEVTTGGSAPQDRSDFGGTVPFVRVSHLANDRPAVLGSDFLTTDAVRKYRLRVFPAGTIVFPKSGASIRLEKRAILPFDACVVSHLAALIPNVERVDPLYLFFHLLQTKLADNNSDGYPTLRITDIGRLPVQLPPVEDQRQIVKILSTIQRARDASSAELQRAMDLKLTMVRDAFQLEGHEIVSCADVSDVLSVGIVVRPTQYYTSDGVLALRSQNVREDELDLRDIVRIDRDAHTGQVAKSALRPGDVVIVRTGYPGTSAVIPAELTEVNCIDLVFLRPSGRVHPEYLSRFFNSPSGRSQALAAKTGLAQQHLNVGAVGRTQVPLPPLDVQREIVERLRSVDLVIKATRNYLVGLDALLAATLRKTIGSSE